MSAFPIEAARTIIRTAIAKARAEAMKPLAVVVVDAGGHMVAAEREDGCPAGRIQVAGAKAHGVAMLGIPGSGLRDRVLGGGLTAAFVGAANGLFDGKLVPVQGGVLVRGADGAILGAVGISGDTSENDAAAALAGIEAAGLAGES